MDVEEARKEARALMDAHGLEDWAFEFDESRKWYGRCWYQRRTISLSRRLVALNDERHTINTILHEIAHAHAGHLAGHGPEWRRAAVRVGARPERCYGPEVKRPSSTVRFSL